VANTTGLKDKNRGNTGAGPTAPYATPRTLRIAARPILGLCQLAGKLLIEDFAHRQTALS
jgi:hypothetical protein